jgi:Cu-Zn family superoxide dismutase
MKLPRLTLVALGVTMLAACHSFPTQPVPKGQASLEAKSGSQVAGNVDFTERADKMIVSTKISGLKPNASHGFHIHEKGDCSSPDAMTAGGHFNPDGMPHSGPHDAMHHAGDMGNLVSDSNGNAVMTIEMDKIRLDNGKYGILDRAVVVHANPDDYKTQPTGNSGGRIACGVIKKV